MSPSKNESTLSQPKTPRAAAIAGIIFSILLMTIMFLIQDLLTVNPTRINQEWLQKHVATASLALKLVPFAGIAFLWFTGVLRDWLDDREDRFF